MRQASLRLSALAFGLSLSAVLGGALSAEASQVAAEECEFNMCGVESGNCFVTDVSWKCKEVAGGCEATYCNAS